MISTSALDSKLINKIAQDLAQATSSAVVVVNIHGNGISEPFNFTPFCQLMHQHPQHNTCRRISDRYGRLEASKSDQLCIYRCYVGLTGLSVLLVIAERLVGFMFRGRIRLSNGIGLVNIPNINSHWQANLELVDEFRNVPEMDYSRVIVSVDSPKLIAESCLRKQLNFAIIKDNPQQSEPVRVNRSTNPHDSKMKKALRYIDVHLSDDPRLEDVASHVSLGPYCFNKLFKKYQGIGFDAWVNR